MDDNDPKNRYYSHKRRRKVFSRPPSTKVTFSVPFANFRIALVSDMSAT